MSKEALWKRILEAKVRQPPLNNERIIAPMRRLVLKLLVRNPSQRIDAASALKQEWLLEDCGDEPSVVTSIANKVSETVIKRLTSFAGTSKFEKALLMLAAHQVCREQVDEMRETFLAFCGGESG